MSDCEDSIDDFDSLNHRAARLMERSGGGFAACIAQAYFRADSDNRGRLLSAFSDLFDRYRRLTVQLDALKQHLDEGAVEQV